MISCYELRLGNSILVNGNIQQVSMITAKTIFTVDAEQGLEHKASEYSLEKVEPVPLTNELLKQCGFLYHDYFKFWQLVTTGIRSEMDISPDFEVIDFMRKPIIKKLTSLHQLQNVYFMLKGRELKLNMNMMALA
jgi:hypothetical protein